MHCYYLLHGGLQRQGTICGKVQIICGSHSLLPVSMAAKIALDGLGDQNK